MRFYCRQRFDSNWFQVLAALKYFFTDDYNRLGDDDTLESYTVFKCVIPDFCNGVWNFDACKAFATFKRWLFDFRDAINLQDSGILLFGRIFIKGKDDFGFLLKIDENISLSEQKLDTLIK